MTEVTVYMNSTLAHFNQLYCGLELMRKNNLIKLNYKFEEEKYIGGGVTRVFVDDKNVMIDIRDSNKIDMNSYNKSDFYFKRMLLKEDKNKYSKIHPFGLNYSVMAANKSLKYLFLKDLRYLKYSLKYHKIFTNFFKINDSIVNCNFKNFERTPNYQLKDLILFSTRLWNPDNNSEKWNKEERKILNNQRISLIRFLKKEYGKLFVGGIQSDNFSKIECPELLLKKSSSNKKQYLKLLKKTTICVSNQGLEDSIGWKFAEYICNSSAILTTPIDKYKMLGPLKDGVNYLTFNSEEEFEGQLQVLLSNKDLYNSMICNNFDYYKKYIDPLSKMTKIIEIIKNS